MLTAMSLSNRLAGIVPEGHVAKLDRALDPGEDDGVWLPIWLRLLVYDLEDALGPGPLPATSSCKSG